MPRCAWHPGKKCKEFGISGGRSQGRGHPLPSLQYQNNPLTTKDTKVHKGKPKMKNVRFA